MSYYRVYKTFDEKNWKVVLAIIKIDKEEEEYGELGAVVATDIPTRDLARSIADLLNKDQLKINKNFWKC